MTGNGKHTNYHDLGEDCCYTLIPSPKFVQIAIEIYSRLACETNVIFHSYVGLQEGMHAT